MSDLSKPLDTRALATSMIHVCPLSRLADVAAAIAASHVISLIREQQPIPTPHPVTPGNHLRLAFHDIEAPREGYFHPTSDHVGEVIDFALGWNHRAPLLIHCWAGISRSTAAAYISLCTINPEASEAAIARSLRQASPTASPNRLMVAHADELLGRRGRMVAAIESIGRGEIAMEGTPFSLRARIADPV